MNRVNLLSTDQSSSGSKMTTTGQANHTGSTRTKAAKGLFSHFMFLASLLLITLLTSGKALATDYDVTLANAENCGLTVSPTTTDGNTKEFTLSVTNATTHKLPTEITSITVNGTPVDKVAAGVVEEADGFTYSAGTITIGSGVTIDGDVAITAVAEEKSTDVSLKSLTYSIEALSIENAVIDLTEGTYDYTVDLGAYLADGEAITLTAQGDADGFPAITTNEGIDSYDGSGDLEDKAIITVTAENTTVTQNYTITFKSKDKLVSVTPIVVTQLGARYATSNGVITALQSSNATATVTSARETVSSLDITWSYEKDDNGGDDYDPAGGATNTFKWTLPVDLGGLVNPASAVKVTGTVDVANIDANASTELSTLTYAIAQGGATAVASDGDLSKEEYSVELPFGTAANADITVNVASTDYATAKVDQNAPATEFTVTLVSGVGSLVLTITSEDGEQTRTVTVNFSIGAEPASDDATISKLFYQIEGSDAVEIGTPQEAGSGTNDVTVPFNTTSVKVSVTPTDKGAKVGLTEEQAPISVNDAPEEVVVTPTTFEFDVPITGATTEFKFTITAEDKQATKNFVIKFTVDAEKITEVTVPTEYKLPKVADDVEAVKLLLAEMEGVTIKTNGNTDLKPEWSYNTADNDNESHTKGAFNAAGGATNVFTWTVQSGLEVIEGGVKTTGKTTVTNLKVVTGTETTVDISAQNPVDKIGDGGTTPTTIETVTVAVGTTAKQLTIDYATVSTALTLNESIGEIVLNKAKISKVVLAEHKTTTLTLQSGNQIDKITNAGTLTLQNAEATPAVATQSMAIGTRAALANNGAVGAVENNGDFTDMTATIVVVGGKAALSLTTLPQNQSTYGKEVTLAVVAETTTGEDITYKWQKYSGGWVEASGTEASLKIKKTGDGSTDYRCEVKSTKDGATTTLYTPAVTVTFRTESEPSEPSNPSTPTYTVSLDKVAGATFSKGEKTTVDAGDSFSFKITLDKDYDQSKPIVTVDGKAITADADGSYTIKNIQTDIKIVVSGIVKNTATGIEDTVEDAARAWTVGSTLYIHVPETSDVYVVSGTGALQQQLRGVSGDYNMQLRAGFYIVRIGEVSQKVIIR